MNGDKEYIDIENFDRKGLFNYFLQFEQPRYCIVTKVDVTKPYNYAKTHGHFNACLVYAITKACNSVENFKYFIKDEKTICKYSCLNAGNTFMTADNQIRYGILDVMLSFDKFVENYEKMKEEIYQNGSSQLGNHEENFVGLSCIKWFKFSGMQEITKNKFHSGPEITWDMLEFEEDKAYVNMAICVNHALVDGFHIHLFLDSLKKEFEKFSI